MDGKRKYGILETDLNAIVNVVANNTKIKQIILFGSRAMNRNSPGSDIDLALKGEKLNLDDIISAKVALDELSLPYRIDLVIYDRIDEDELIHHIDRTGIRLF